MGIRSFNNPIQSFLDNYTKSGNDAATKKGISATGGSITDYYDPIGLAYRAHIFTSSGTFQVNGIGDYGSNVEYLVVAGGGGGGTGSFGPFSSGGTGPRGGGGGGAGGLRTNSSTFSPVSNGLSYPVSISSYPIVVGSGGAADAQGSPSVFNAPGVEGSTKFTSTGGGYGNGGAGGCGGGGLGSYGGGFGNSPPTSPLPPQGQNGYSGGSPIFNAGSPSILYGGPGGSITQNGGLVSIFDGSTKTYSQGGPGPGGSAGAPGYGGGAYGPGPGSSQTGASGVVIIRYRISNEEKT